MSIRSPLAAGRTAVADPNERPSSPSTPDPSPRRRPAVVVAGSLLAASPSRSRSSPGPLRGAGKP